MRLSGPVLLLIAPIRCYILPKLALLWCPCAWRAPLELVHGLQCVLCIAYPEFSGNTYLRPGMKSLPYHTMKFAW